MDYGIKDVPMKEQNEMKSPENRMVEKRERGRMSRMNNTADKRQQEQRAEEVYSMIAERMCMAICFHEQLADYFCFLGLQGFKRMCEYQYMKECAGKRKLHRKYIDMHHKVIPVTSGGKKPVMIPSDWSRYTTQDIDDSVVPKFVKMGLEQYYEWENETKDILTEQCEMLMSWNMIADYEFIKTIILDVEKEIKKINRLIESMNITGYDVNAIHGVQDKYHGKYKQKYEERFTKKHNGTGRTINADNPAMVTKNKYSRY